MSMVYHSYDASGVAQNELVAGAYAEHVGTLGYDENLSTISRNAVENRVITARILQDETDYLLKTEAETKYAVEYVNTTPVTIQDKIYVINGNAFLGNSTNATLTQLSKVVTVNNQSPDSNGNVSIDVGVKTVNSQTPDSNGNVDVDTGVMTVNGVSPASGDIVAVTSVNNTAPDANGNVNIQASVTSVNGQTGAVTIDTGAMTVNSQTPDSSGNVNVEAADIPTSTTGVTVQGALNLAATRSYVQGLYPVGTIYMNDVATIHPFDFGTWQLIDSKFLYGCASNFSDIGNTGGASTVTLTQANLPAGNVPVQFPTVTGTTGNPNIGWDPTFSLTYNVGGGGSIKTFTRTAAKDFASVSIHMADKDHTHSFTIPAQTLNISLGSGTAFSIIPPYKKVAIWHRIQ